MRTCLRVAGFRRRRPAGRDCRAAAIGVLLGWPLWWVAVGSMLCLLIVQAMLINF